MIQMALTTTVRGYVQQFWRDLLSIYYANTPIWRWLKSGALLFLGVGLWAGGSAVYSVTSWTPILFVMAYGFLLIFWGPLTHLGIVPLTIRLRRTAETKPGRLFARNSGKINLSIFFTCVILLATLSPGVMMLEFSPSVGDDTPDVSGELLCSPEGGTVSCEVSDPQGIDHVVVKTDGETIRTIEAEPFEFELDRDELEETSSGHRFVVEYRDSNDKTLRRFIEVV